MLKRTLTGACLIAVVVGFFLLRNISADYFQILVLMLAALGTIEMLNAFKDETTVFQKVTAGTFAVVFIEAFALYGSFAVSVGILIFFSLMLLSDLVFEYEKVTLTGLGYSFLSMVYPSVLLLPMLAVNTMAHNSTIFLVLIFVISPCSDTLAYLVGSLIGGKKMCPNISPKKTISGGIGGIAGGIIGSIVVYFIMKDSLVYDLSVPAVVYFALIGLVASFLTEFGDLVESVIKRKIGIKDMGHILPGHGGILDRIDSIIFACPFICMAGLIL